MAHPSLHWMPSRTQTLLLATMQRVESKLGELQKDVKNMATREENFAKALADLTTAVTAHMGDIKNAISEAIAAHEVDDEAAFAKATSDVQKLTDTVNQTVAKVPAPTEVIQG
jgi:DnaJ-domain-containing protein 1